MHYISCDHQSGVFQKLGKKLMDLPNCDYFDETSSFMKGFSEICGSNISENIALNDR